VVEITKYGYRVQMGSRASLVMCYIVVLKEKKSSSVCHLPGV